MLIDKGLPFCIWRKCFHNILLEEQLAHSNELTVFIKIFNTQLPTGHPLLYWALIQPAYASKSHQCLLMDNCLYVISSFSIRVAFGRTTSIPYIKTGRTYVCNRWIDVSGSRSFSPWSPLQDGFPIMLTLLSLMLYLPNPESAQVISFGFFQVTRSISCFSLCIGHSSKILFKLLMTDYR